MGCAESKQTSAAVLHSSRTGGSGQQLASSNGVGPRLGRQTAAAAHRRDVLTDDEWAVILKFRDQIGSGIPPSVAVASMLKEDNTRNAKLIPLVRAANDPPAIRYRKMILHGVPATIVFEAMNKENVDSGVLSFVLNGGGDEYRPGDSFRASSDHPISHGRLPRESTFNKEGLVVQEIIRGPVTDNTKPVYEDGIAFGYRQARNSEEDGDWGLRPGYDTPYFVCDRRFSSYPDVVLRGTNEAYDELKRQIKAGPDCHSLPLYLGAKLARDPLNPNANKWMVRPGWDTPCLECERCYSEFPDEVMFGTNIVYDALERKLKETSMGESSTSKSDHEDEMKFEAWKDVLLDAERICRQLYFNGGSQENFAEAKVRLENIKLLGMIHAMHWGVVTYTPYINMCEDLQKFCEMRLEIDSFGPLGTIDEAVGIMQNRGPPLSDKEAHEHSALVGWRREFARTEKVYRKLAGRGDVDPEEYEELFKQFQLRITGMQVVEKAVGAAPLRPYLVLVKIYLALLRKKIDDRVESTGVFP